MELKLVELQYCTLSLTVEENVQNSAVNIIIMMLKGITHFSPVSTENASDYMEKSFSFCQLLH